MGLLDFDDTYVAPYNPPKIEKDTHKSDEETNLRSLNLMGRKVLSDDYSDEIKY